MAHQSIARNFTLIFARVVGVAAAGTVTILWSWLLLDPANKGGITGGTYVVGGIMIGLALLAAWSAWTLKPWALVVAFVASFFPFGFYLLGTPGIFMLVGVANVLYLFAGALISLEQYRMRRR